jgi:hypothetical protein
MFCVSSFDELNEGAHEPRLSQLADRLLEIEERLRREMRARGFDPDQSDNLALTAPLAKLYAEREHLRAELATLTETESE